MGPNDLPPPPSEIPASSRPQMSIQLDGAGCAVSHPQGHTQQQQQQQQYSQSSTGGGIGGVDLSRLQPGPMDQLRPRQHNDPPWAPHHYIQKGKLMRKVIVYNPLSLLLVLTKTK